MPPPMSPRRAAGVVPNLAAAALAFAGVATFAAAPARAQQITVFSDNFSTYDSAKWASTSGLYGGTVYSGGASYTSYFPNGGAFYFDSATGTGRQAVTQQIDMSRRVAKVTFDLRYETVGGGIDAFPFEDIDNGEEIVLEYSTNGSTWTNVATYQDNVNTYRNWASVTVNLASGAWTSTTQLRFRQLGHSGTDFDMWAIDNLVVMTNPEPGTWALFGIGTAALGALVRRRRRARMARAATRST